MAKEGTAGLARGQGRVGLQTRAVSVDARGAASGGRRTDACLMRNSRGRGSSAPRRAARRQPPPASPGHGPSRSLRRTGRRAGQGDHRGHGSHTHAHAHQPGGHVGPAVWSRADGVSPGRRATEVPPSPSRRERGAGGHRPEGNPREAPAWAPQGRGADGRGASRGASGGVAVWDPGWGPRARL